MERPLRLNFQVTPERLARLQAHKAFLGLAESKKKDAKQKTCEEMAGRQQQEAILGMLAAMPDPVFKDRSSFENTLEKAAKTAKVKLTAPLRKAILAALSERDETAEICRDAEGHPEPDPELRDSEQVPLKEDIHAYFDREVRPHVPDAWINTAVRDHKDGEVGKVGYEINFNRYFYKYQPPRPLEDIEADIKDIERENLELIKGLTA